MRSGRQGAAPRAAPALAWLLVSWLALGMACAPATAPTAQPTRPAPTASGGGAAAGAAPAAAVAQPAASSAAASTPSAAGASAGPPAVVRIADVQISSQAGNYIAADKGYFRAAGIEAEFVPIRPQDILPLMTQQQLDVGFLSINAALYNGFARGLQIKIVAEHGANLRGASASGVVVRKDLADSGAIRGPADYRDRKVGSAATSDTNTIAFERYLNQAGLSLEDIDYTFLPFADVLTALENRGIDAAYLQEPFITIGEARGWLVRGPIGHDLYPDQQIGVLVFGDRMLNDRALAQRYMTAYVRGVRDYVKGLRERDPAMFDAVVPILIQHTTVKDRALFERAVPSGLRPDPLPNLQSMIDDQEWFIAKGLQTQRINVPDIVELQFVEQAIRELGSADR